MHDKIIKLAVQSNKMKFLFTIFLVLFIGSVSNAQSFKQLKKGRWVGALELTFSEKLYFELKVDKKESIYHFTVLNGEERVPMNKPYLANDSIHVFFSNFNSELVFKVVNNKRIDGRWINHLKSNYSIPFYATLSESTIFPVSDDNAADFSGKWQSKFSPDKDSYDAIGVFKQKGNELTGTFLTETGDFRFLSGNVNRNTMYLSGFDGSHAFLFKGELTDGKIKGSYFSGIHYKTNWEAEVNDSFELRHPDSLTQVVGDPRDISLKFRELDGSTFFFPNDTYKNKVVVIQILGTWCGNCMDETIYFKELYNKYHHKGLEIISVGYELGEEFPDFVGHLKAYQNRFELNHKIVVGGSAKKSNAKEDFGFLSDFTSFPTSIFIDRSGKVVRIHTGFSGPSTGKYYSEYKEKTEKLIEQLISE